MTSPILPSDGPSTTSGLPNTMPLARATAGDPAAFESELAANDRGQSRLTDSETGGGTPPPEVLDQIAVAGRISRQMRESGHELRFSEGQGGRIAVELADREGNTVKSMLVSEALEIAVGRPLV